MARFIDLEGRLINPEEVKRIGKNSELVFGEGETAVIYHKGERPPFGLLMSREKVLQIFAEDEEKTLRDKFAGDALQGYMAGAMKPELSPGAVVTPDMIAERAYAYADAMIKARGKK